VNYKAFFVICVYYAMPVIALNTSANFGKRHFIIGYTEGAEQTVQQEAISEQSAHQDIPFDLMHDNQIKAVYFAPHDDVHAVLDYLIAHEKEKIQVAMFAFTDRTIANALIDARKRGVQIEVITDANNTFGRYNKTDVLHTNNINVYVYNPKHTQQATTGAMHNKFLVFQKNILDKSLVWTGSFNLTRSAHQQNQENVLVLDDSFMVQKFNNKFAQLKTCCTYYRVPVPVTPMHIKSGNNGEK